jgi:organic radical activating enzyme
VFTGGEPALQYNDIRKVINTVRGINLSVKFGIETNGTLLFDESIFDVVVVSPKRADIAKGWSDRPNVCIKFLAGNERDLAVIRKQMDAYMFANIPYVMPIGDTKEKIMQVSKKLVPVMLKTGMNVIWSPRLHILMEVK